MWLGVIAVNYLIDGHNLIPKIPGLSLSDLNDEEQLIELLVSFSKNTRSKIEVYFDKASIGSDKKKVIGHVKVVYVSIGFRADDVIIKKLLGLKKEAKNWVVVTSDRQIISAASSVHAKVIRSEDFSELLTSTKYNKNVDEKNDDISQEEIDEWIQLFQNKLK